MPPIDWTNTLVGIGAGIVSSLLFLFVLRLLPPRLSISPEIAKTVLGGETVFTIKVTNRGYRDAINLRAELLLIVPDIVAGGEIHRVGRLTLHTEELFRLAKYSKTDPSMSYAFRFVTSHDLDALWPADRKAFLRFIVFAQDSLSSFPKVFSREFHSKYQDMVSGDFDRGLSDGITYIKH